MERIITQCLVKWKNKVKRKPLVLKGVRQCGKTYILKEFGEKYYKDTAYFNFEENETLWKVFDNDYDIKRIIFELSLYHGKTIKPGETLIIFDEIQSCGRAITSLKYFCENAPEYHLACAGSLLGISINENLSFPVGKVDFLSLYPMSFYEFLIALGEETLAEHLCEFSKGEKISELIGSKLSHILKQYYVTGGMPEVVEAWIDTKEIERVEEIQQEIINSYELDFAKHAPPKDHPKLTAIWKSIPAQLAKTNSKFIFGHVKKGWRAKDLEDALMWLINAGLVYKVCKIEKPYMPMSSYKDETAFKLYVADVGILRKMSKLPYQVVLESSAIYTEFKGAMTENYVLGELIKSVDESPYYWTSGNQAEVDFVVQCDEYIVPIEVKSEKNVRAKSLGEYRKKYEPAFSVKTSMKNETNGNEVLNIPLYMIGSMKNFLKK